MTDTQTTLDYHVACLMEIADVPAAEREELADSIESAVNEVAAETDMDLHEILGPPARFVAELRAAAGVAESNRTRTLRLSVPRVDISAVTSHAWARWLRTLIVDLRPAWWVARAWLLALVIGAINTGWADMHLLFGVVPMPTVSDTSRTMSTLVTAVLVVASVNLGRQRFTGNARRAAIAANVLVALVGMSALAELADSPWLTGRSGESPIAEAAMDIAPLRGAIDGSMIDTFVLPDGSTEDGHLMRWDLLTTRYPADQIAVRTVDGTMHVFESRDQFWDHVERCALTTAC